MLRVYACIADQHDLRLVLVAVLICLFACFTAFSLMERAEAAKGSTRYAWLAVAALVTGCGVWATHFVAMLAFQPGLPVSYDVELTALSVFIAIAMSGAGFLVALDGGHPVAGGTIVGAAIAAMHFVGMAALQLPAVKSWDFVYVAASLFIGSGSGAAALVSRRERNLRNRFLSATLLALGICGMHFTALAALSFIPDPLVEISEQAVAADRVAIAVIIVAVVIVVAGLIGSIIDQRLAQRAAVDAERLRLHVSELELATKALRQSEERLRSIAENLPGFLFQCRYEPESGLHFKLIGSNKFTFDTMPRAEDGSVHALDLVMEDDSANLETTAIAACRCRSGWEYTFRVAASDGSWPWVRAIARPAHGSNGRLWDGIALDETDRIATSAQNAKLQAKLRQAEKMEAIGTLAGGVAHELNNLLQPVIMMTELVVAELRNGSPYLDRLNRVIDAGAKAAEIVQRILAFGRADEVAHNLLDSSFIAREAISFIRTILPSSITLHVNIDDTVGHIRGDKTQLTQVLINLATNARDAIGANVGQVWVSLSSEAVMSRTSFSLGALSPGRYAVLTVRDTGSGMDDVTAKRIFEPFFTTKGVGKGTGLGLSVTHGIVASHGGAIRMESEQGHGATFSIYLPIAEAELAVAAAGGSR